MIYIISAAASFSLQLFHKNALPHRVRLQVCNEGDYIERVMFYWAREFASAIPSAA